MSSLEPSNTPKKSIPSESEEEKSELSTPPHEIVYPEGGTRAWLTVLGAFLVQFTTFGFVNAYGVFNDFYVRIYLSKSSSSQIGWIGSVQLCVALSMSLVTGPLFDRGYFHHLLIFGSLIYVICIFMVSLTHQQSYWQVFFSHGIGVGLGTGLAYLPSLSIAAHYFHRRRALVMGIFSAGASLGAIVRPIMLNKLINGRVGFHTTLRISGGMDAFLLVLANLLVRTRLPPRRSTSLTYSKDFFRNTAYNFSVLGAFLSVLGIYVPIFFIQLFAVTRGMDEEFAFYTVAILQAANLLGRIIPQLFLQYIGLLNLLFICTASTAVLSFAMLAVKDIGGTVAFAIIYGFFSGATIALIPPVFATFAGNFGEVGARIGLGVFLAGVAGLIGSPIAGAFLGKSFNWTPPITWTGGILTAAALSFLACRIIAAKLLAKQTS